ncbi:hypothetical protein ACFL1G_07025 [Planctomycetota bacterium]
MILLIIIAVGLVLYFVDFSKFISKPDPDTTEGLKPWKEWDLRQMSEAPVKEISAEQPEITEYMSFKGNVVTQDTSGFRGKIELEISPDGGVNGSWSGSFYNEEKVNFEISGCSFSGNIYPGKKYQDEKGQDLSKLYCLAKGSFMFHRTNFDTGSYKIVAGEIYVRGWIDEKLELSGEIIITSDKKFFQTFNWTARKTSSPDLFLPSLIIE